MSNNKKVISRKKKAMNPEDSNKIDLSSVNKVSRKKRLNTKKGKQFSLSNLFQRQSGQKRDTEGKFTTGSGGLKKIKSFNLKRAFPLIGAITIVGGFFVFQSFASGNNSFVTEMYQRCHNTMQTSGSGYDYWLKRLNGGEDRNTVWAAFVAASGSSCQYQYPPPAKPAPAPAQQPQQPAQPAPTTTSPTPTPTPAAKPDTTGGNGAFVTEMYQRCHNKMQTSGSGYDYWLNRLNQNESRNSVWAAFVAAAGTGCQYPYPPATQKPAANSPQTPPASGTKPEKKYHQGRSASPDCFSMSNCVTVVRELYRTLLARDPGPDSTGVKDYASKMLDWGWTKAQVTQNIKQSTEYQNHQVKTQANIRKYDPSLTDFMDTRSFLWFAYEQLCYSGTRSAVNYWTKEIDSGRWTRKAFWEHLQSQQCAENVSNERLYNSSGQNLTEDGKRAKEIDQELNKVYWEVFLKMWEAGGWKDWDGVHKPGWQKVYNSGDKHLATQMACEEIVWKYKKGIPVGLDDTCFALVTGQNKPVHSQDIMYGDYFGDTVTMEEAKNRIRAVARGEDQSVSCQSVKAQVLPGCNSGAKYVPLKDVEKELEKREEEKKSSSTSPNAQQNQNTNTSSNQNTQTSPNTSSQNNTNSSQGTTPSASSNNDADVYAGSVSQDTNLQKYLDIENRAMAAIIYPECDGITEVIELDGEGNCVSFIQNAMALLVDPDARVSGIFDLATQNDLIGFQISRNIPISEQGTIGVTTHRLLKKALEPRIMKSPYAPPKGMFVNNR